MILIAQATQLIAHRAPYFRMKLVKFDGELIGAQEGSAKVMGRVVALRRFENLDDLFFNAELFPFADQCKPFL